MIPDIANLMFSIDMFMASVVGFILAIITLYFIFRDSLLRYWRAVLHVVQEGFDQGANGHDVDQAGRLTHRQNIQRRD